MIEGCERVAQARGCCSTHYRQYCTGEVFRLAKWRTTTVCAEKGCERSSHAKGLCSLHYDRRFSAKSITRAGVPCRVCGETRGTQRCHVKPRRSGGTSGDDNIIPLCPTHHWCFDNGSLTPVEDAKL
jgi:hypothetical protein